MLDHQVHDPLLTVRDLKKHFPIKRGLLKRQVALCKALDGVSFEVRPQEIVGIVGESGCGKSTLARAAIRLVEPTAGEIFYKHENLRSFSKERLRQWRPKVQMVFQDPFSSLNPRKTVGENITEAACLQQLVATNQKNDLGIELLARVGLSAADMRRYPHQFSGGQQQRVCIARALALNPELLICDEAVSSLDVSVQAQILNLILEIKDKLGLGVIFISHDLGIVRHLCDRIIVLYLGKAVESGPTEELFTHPQHPYTQALLSAIPKRHPREQRARIHLNGEPPSPLNPPSGCPFHPRCPVAQSLCSREYPPCKTARIETHTYSCVRSLETSGITGA